ncbi:MAG: hypothetical protein AB7E72_04740 [Lysobacterales bacterium]
MDTRERQAVAGNFWVRNFSLAQFVALAERLILDLRLVVCLVRIILAPGQWRGQQTWHQRDQG